jgi:DNA-binding response OmpR family regulator
MKDNQILPMCPPGEAGGVESLTPATSDISRRESASPQLQSQSNPLHRILVVEDDLLILQLNTRMLKRAGYEVDAAEDGAAAWKTLNAASYDLLITDNVMPKITGVKLLEKLRAARMALPVIMATSALPTAVFARCPWLQPNATLLKPYTASEMLRTVKKVLREADTTS